MTSRSVSFGVPRAVAGHPHSRGRVTSLLAASSLLVACGSAADPPTHTHTNEPAIAVPEGFPAFPAPDDNVPTAERVALGRRLFYDERLSRTDEISCSSCHLQRDAFADPNRVSSGVDGQTGTRNAPALVNLAWGTSFFWHGGASSLEVQAVGPIKNPLEMDTSLAEVAGKLSQDAALLADFQAAYDEAPNESTITRALASFVRSLVSGGSAYDRYLQGEAGALSEAAVRGEALFNGERAECFHCHTGFNFTNNGFRNDGSDPSDPDQGRREVTLKDSDFAKFKIPTLRNVAVSAPYMHDGALETLDDVIDAYVAGGRGHPSTDPTITPLELTTDDKADLRAFLESLTDDDFLSNPAFADPDPP
jgi:cytochrome c peroxidase